MKPKPTLAADAAPRLRIALVTDAIFPYHHGGKEIRTHELPRRLSRYGEVHVYTMKWWRGSRVRREGDVVFHAIAPRLPLYAKGRRSILQALVFATCCLSLAVARFDALEADHMPYWQLLPLWLITRLRRKRFVTWHEAWGPSYWRTYMGRGGIVGWWLELLTMHLPHAIIAASPHTAARLAEWVEGKTKVVIAPNGIDLEMVRSVSPAPAHRDIVCVGRLLSHKRVDLLIDAIAYLRQSEQAPTCTIVGDGPEREALQAQIERLALQDRVQLLSGVNTQQAMYAELKAARAFVFPSEREGFGIAALEALACGLTVITTSAPDNMAQHLVRQSANGRVSPTLVFGGDRCRPRRRSHSGP